MKHRVMYSLETNEDIMRLMSKLNNTILVPDISTLQYIVPQRHMGLFKKLMMYDDTYMYSDSSTTWQYWDVRREEMSKEISEIKDDLLRSSFSKLLCHKRKEELERYRYQLWKNKYDKLSPILIEHFKNGELLSALTNLNMVPPIMTVANESGTIDGGGSHNLVATRGVDEKLKRGTYPLSKFSLGDDLYKTVLLPDDLMSAVEHYFTTNVNNIICVLKTDGIPKLLPFEILSYGNELFSGMVRMSVGRYVNTVFPLLSLIKVTCPERYEELAILFRSNCL